MLEFIEKKTFNETIAEFFVKWHDLIIYAKACKEISQNFSVHHAPSLTLLGSQQLRKIFAF